MHQLIHLQKVSTVNELIDEFTSFVCVGNVSIDAFTPVVD
jgi:hypothetical protein